VKNIAVIIVAAGRGSRAGAGTPKQYCTIAGEMLLRRTVSAIVDALPEAKVQVVIHPDDIDIYQIAVANLTVLPPVLGADTRQQSVRNGLKALEGLAPDYVLVHDAARPFVSKPLINNVLAALESGCNAVVPATSVTDTLKSVKNETISHTVGRDGLYTVQTPQGFCFKTLLEAHLANQDAGLTDDAAVMEASGHAVHISAGDTGNFKVTHSDDFKKAESVVMNLTADVRVGSGYDVHRFKAGDHLWLCGIKMPFIKSLKGHSDADVGLHALTDALLSAVSAGDIGTHFPPSEEKWRGVSSEIFVNKAAEIIRDLRGVIAHVTVCLICERPKIGPHMDTMRTKISSLLAIDVSRVSVQATTTEKLGFTGREEGIAAQATVTVRLPM